MEFFTYWMISVIVAFFASRMAVKALLKDEDDFFEDSVGLLAMMFICPFIPFANILYVVLLICGAIYAYIVHRGASRFAMKIFLIREKEERKK